MSEDYAPLAVRIAQCKDLPLLGIMDQFKFLGNCPPTPPLSQHSNLPSHLGQNVGLGEG